MPDYLIMPIIAGGRGLPRIEYEFCLYPERNTLDIEASSATRVNTIDTNVHVYGIIKT